MFEALSEMVKKCVLFVDSAPSIAAIFARVLSLLCGFLFVSPAQFVECKGKKLARTVMKVLLFIQIEKWRRTQIKANYDSVCLSINSDF